MDVLDLLLLGLAGIALLLWLLAPLLVRLTFRHEVAPALVPCEPVEVPDLPDRYIAPHVEALEALGFEDCGLARVAPIPKVTLWLALLRNDRDGLMACVSVAIQDVPASGPRRHMEQVELATVWPDGREILTSNLAEPLAIQPLPEHDLLQVPGEQDLERLLAVHAARVARFTDDAPANPARGEELESVEAVLARTLAYQVERGWMWLDETHGQYRATLRGAWHMTNTQLFPWSLLHKRRIARRAAGALARLGLGVPLGA